MSEDLAKFLGLQLNPRNQALNVRLSDFSVRHCESFVRAHIQIDSWAARMAFVVLPTGVPLVLGMPFFDRFEPRIKWRQRQFIIADNATSHTLQADLLPRAIGPADSTCIQRPLSSPPRSATACFFSAANVDITTTIEPTAQERSEIEQLTDATQPRVLH